MPLKPAMELIARAQVEGYAVGYFESWNLESLQGVIDAAEESRSPVLVGFNGEFLSRKGRLTSERLAWYAALGRAAAESADVPCGLIFNECSDDERVREAAELGFSLVMPDDPAADSEAFIPRLAELTRYAHRRGVAVEAEVGQLPCGAEGEISAATGALTDAENAARYVNATGIDIMAVSVGNVHVMLHGSRGLNLAQLAAIRRRVKLPFDLHGGTGIQADSLRAAIRLGVAKVCFGTYLKQRYLEDVRRVLADDEPNPHKRLGFGGEEDLLVVGRLAVKRAVLDRIEWLGCCDKA